MADEDRAADERQYATGVRRHFWMALGFACVALGIIGAILPVMPTTIFLILAVGCFARSSPRFEAMLLDHPHFGASLRAWKDKGAVSRKGKIAACAGMAVGFASLMIFVRPGWPVAVPVALLLLACAAFVVTRPKH
ncbi:MAG: YbaN family protein [Sphingobium sp.]|nr:YbaN family protein [Sphingobium sp.]